MSSPWANYTSIKRSVHTTHLIWNRPTQFNTAQFRWVMWMLLNVYVTSTFSCSLRVADCYERCSVLGAKLTIVDSIFNARCNIGLYISRLCHDATPSVRLSVTEVHWRIIANLGFKFRSHFTAHCGRRAARRAVCGRIISRNASQC